jgi:hypothetical protein
MNPALFDPRSGVEGRKLRMLFLGKEGFGRLVLLWILAGRFFTLRGEMGGAKLSGGYFQNASHAEYRSK